MNTMPKNQSSVLILGAGSIGTTVGIKLKRDGHHVVLGRRRGPFGKNININLIGHENISEKLDIIDINTINDLGVIHPYELIIIATQRQQLQELLEQIQPFLKIHEDAPFLSLQNGINIDRVICEILKQDVKIILGSVWWSATLLDSLNTYYHNSAITTIGISKALCSKTKDEDLQQVFDIFKNEFEIKLSDDIDSEIKKKLMLNVVSPILAYIKQPYPNGLNNLTARKVIHLLFDEAIFIVNSLNWNIKDQRLDNFHQILASTDLLDTSSFDKSLPTHKVSTQISAEKYGGKGSNVRELLGLFVNNGGEKISFILNEIEKLPVNYNSQDINFLEAKLMELKIHRCTLFD